MEKCSLMSRYLLGEGCQQGPLLCCHLHLDDYKAAPIVLRVKLVHLEGICEPLLWALRLGLVEEVLDYFGLRYALDPCQRVHHYQSHHRHLSKRKILSIIKSLIYDINLIKWSKLTSLKKNIGPGSTGYTNA